MRYLACRDCGRRFPLNQTVRLGDASLCESCAKLRVARTPEVYTQAGEIAHQIDATVCSRCQYDNGNEELPPVLGLHLCESCAATFRRRPFPAWVKVSAAALAVVVVLSLYRGARFFQGYRELTIAQRAFKAKQLDTAACFAKAAAEHVPERPDLGGFSAFCEALLLMEQDKPKEALMLLRQAKASAPREQIIEHYLLLAEANAAFDDRNYDAFLGYARTLDERNPGDPYSRLMIASGCACKYAETGEDSFKQEALRHMKEAQESIPPDSDDLRRYEQRIRHRLATREIISAKEFEQRYPDGWQGEGGDP